MRVLALADAPPAVIPRDVDAVLWIGDLEPAWVEPVRDLAVPKLGVHGNHDAPGALAAFGANHHLRQSLVFLDVPAMQQPEAYIGGAAKLFDESGKLTNDGTREFLKKFMESFARWIEKTAAR
jgi:hypothetical protein